MIKKGFALLLAVSCILVSYSGCASEDEAVVRALDGIWTVVTVNGDPDYVDMGTSSALIQYVETLTDTSETEIYAGSVNIDSMLYLIGVTFDTGTLEAQITMALPGAAAQDRIVFTGTLSGGTITGTYTGFGIYHDDAAVGIFEGTFTATR